MKPVVLCRLGKYLSDTFTGKNSLKHVDASSALGFSFDWFRKCRYESSGYSGGVEIDGTHKVLVHADSGRSALLVESTRTVQK